MPGIFDMLVAGHMAVFMPDPGEERLIARLADQLLRRTLGNVTDDARQWFEDRIEATHPDWLQRENAYSRPVAPALGIYSVALGGDRHERSVIFLCDESLVSRPGELDSGISSLLGAVIENLGGQIPRDALVFGVPAPEPHCAPSEPVLVLPQNNGVLGATITTPQGAPGILTAGHVAGSMNAAAWWKGAPIGSVSFTEDPSVGPPTAALGDVAVITLSVALTGVGPSIQMKGQVQPGDDLECHTYHGVAVAPVLAGLAPWVASPNLSGLWGAIYFTMGSFSQPGDSGAPVLLAGTDVIVGHVVGGSGAYTSYVQAIDYQLAVSRCQLRPYP